MGKTTWSARLEENQKVELENRLSELMAGTGNGRGEILLEGLRSLTDDRIMSSSRHGQTLEGGFAALDQAKHIMMGLASAADAVANDTEQQYRQRISELEENLAFSQKDLEKTQSIVREATEARSAAESVLSDKVSLLNQAQAQLMDTKEQLEDTRRRLVSAEKASGKASDSLNAAREENALLRLQVTELEKELAVAKAEVKGNEKLIEALQTKGLPEQGS